jgi:predicted O-methyltransferase YrrM
MSQKPWSAVDQYLVDQFIEPDPALAETLKSSAAANLPPINVSPNQGKLLMILATLMNAKNILEIGTLAGYSTIWLGRALPPEGRLITLEAEPKHAQIARQNIARAGLQNQVEVHQGKALDLLPTLAAEKRNPFDLIFIDADKPNNPAYLEWALELTRPGSLIIIDNVVRDGEVINANSKDPAVQGVRKLNEMIKNEKRITATAIQTVGAKGYDGFAVILVTGSSTI